MLQNAYLLAKIGDDTAENEQHFAKILPKTGNYPTGPYCRRTLTNYITQNYTEPRLLVVRALFFVFLRCLPGTAIVDRVFPRP